MQTEAPYEELRPLLFSIAYRMVSSVSEAEDIVQESFLRIHRAESEGEKIESPKAYLAAVATRLSIDHLRSARVRREQYVGQWLPDPLLTDTAPDAAAQTETADSLRWRSSSCSKASRPSSVPSSCCAKSSPT